MLKLSRFFSTLAIGTFLCASTALAEWQNVVFTDPAIGRPEQIALVKNNQNLLFSIRKYDGDVIGTLFIQDMFHNINSAIAIKYYVDDNTINDLAFTKIAVDAGALGDKYYFVSKKDQTISWKIDPAKRTKGNSPDGDTISSKIPLMLGIEEGNQQITFQLRSNFGENINVQFDLIDAIKTISHIY